MILYLARNSRIIHQKKIIHKKHCLSCLYRKMKHIYSQGRQDKLSDFLISIVIYTILSDAVKEVDFALNTVVVKCNTGMAQAACASFDSMHWEGLVGTIAGDDTIFALCRTPELAQELSNSIAKLLG